MNTSEPSVRLNRRNFLHTSFTASAGLAALNWRRSAQAALIKPEREPGHGLKLGLTSYTLRKFSLEEAIEMTVAAGVKYLSLKDVHLSLKSTPEQRQEARSKIQAAGLTLMGGGVIYLKNDEEEIRNAFQYAKDTGMPTMICSPDPEALDAVERFARQFQIRIAIHNHGLSDKKYPSPLDVLRLVKERDPLMGICMDIGHTVDLAQDPIPVIEQCATRLYDFHIKDVSEPSGKGETVAVGRGIIDIVAVLKTLISIPYRYHLALEYEAKAENPVPGMMESFGYMKGVLAAI